MIIFPLSLIIPFRRYFEAIYRQKKFDILSQIKLGKLSLDNSTEIVQIALQEKFDIHKACIMSSAFPGQVYRRTEQQ